MWYQIKDQDDIDKLLAAYYDFHDSCIRSIEYVSGAGVDEDGGMHMTSRDCTAVIMFDSQMPKYHGKPENKSLELRFSGLRRLDLAGYQNMYFSFFDSCDLELSESFIVWTGNTDQRPAFYIKDMVLEEPLSTTVVADRLEWRFVEPQGLDEIRTDTSERG